MLELVILIIIVALLFDYFNGFHDAANSIATVVSTRVLTPKLAVVWAAWWNFAAAFGFGVSVATTVGKGIVEPSGVTQGVILSGLVGAIAWDIITWYYGLPTSSSHALIGGFIGSAVTRSGIGVILLDNVYKVLIFIVISPLLGAVLGFATMALVAFVLRKTSLGKANTVFKRLQLVSAASYSFGHGTNDAQKTMGIITALLFTSGYLGDTFYVPFWVILAAHAAIGLGTLSGGWRIVKTMGMRLTRLTPVGGFSAETAAAATLVGTAIGGIPVSTTHTIAGAIMGVGSTRRLSAVRWGIARRIVWAWILTIPGSALIAAAFYLLTGTFIP
ncbi:MAG: inorganic phosphate transporter [Thaumarchaeota archaeon]|nr:inorganic phosphate transporter [Nitrososphaerota archaeon]